MHWKPQEIEFTLSTGDTWIVFFPPGMGWVRRFSFLLETSGADKSQTNFLIGPRKISHIFLQFSSVFLCLKHKKSIAHLDLLTTTVPPGSCRDCTSKRQVFGVVKSWHCKNSGSELWEWWKMGIRDWLIWLGVILFLESIFTAFQTVFFDFRASRCSGSPCHAQGQEPRHAFSFDNIQILDKLYIGKMPCCYMM